MGENYRRVAREIREQKKSAQERVLAYVTYHRRNYRVLWDPNIMRAQPIHIEVLYDIAGWMPAMGLEIDQEHTILQLALSEIVEHGF